MKRFLSFNFFKANLWIWNSYELYFVGDNKIYLNYLKILQNDRLFWLSKILENYRLFCTNIIAPPPKNDPPNKKAP